MFFNHPFNKFDFAWRLLSTDKKANSGDKVVENMTSMDLLPQRPPGVLSYINRRP